MDALPEIVLKTNDSPDDLLKPTEVAAALNVTLSTLEAWRCRGNGPNLPFVKLGSTRAAPIRYRRSHVARLVAENTHDREAR